jgi:predicted protein tyrosine phosphatase
MPKIRSIDMIFLDDLFEMGGGYVLDFTNPTFSRFFSEELDVDIDAPIYAEHGGSKGKRLRCFLHKAEAPIAVKALQALWEYREATRAHRPRPETVNDAKQRLDALIARLEGKPVAAAAAPQPAQTAQTAPRSVDTAKLAMLRDSLIALSSLAPHPRGYAFEVFLRDLFDAFGLEAREPFRLRGEQIDGSFALQGETYLVEAKWEAAPTEAGDLHKFHGKLEQKAAWTRGLFVSNSGFTQGGLDAFGRGKRVVCMDGLDLFEVLSRELSLAQVLERKVRRAAETGLPFVRVRDLFPA